MLPLWVPAPAPPHAVRLPLRLRNHGMAPPLLTDGLLGTPTSAGAAAAAPRAAAPGRVACSPSAATLSPAPSSASPS